jgi:hypothetical protein
MNLIPCLGVLGVFQHFRLISHDVIDLAVSVFGATTPFSGNSFFRN